MTSTPKLPDVELRSLDLNFPNGYACVREALELSNPILECAKQSGKRRYIMCADTGQVPNIMLLVVWCSDLFPVFV